MKNNIIKAVLLLIVIIGVIFSVFSISKAYYVTNWNTPTGIALSSSYTVTSSPELAWYVRKDANTFLNLNTNAIYNKTLNRAGFKDPDAGKKISTISYCSAACMFHREGDLVSGAGLDVISDVIDIKFDPSAPNNYIVYNNNTGTNQTYSFNSEDKAKLVRAIGLAYENPNEGTFTPKEKMAINYLFYNLFKDRGIITSNFITNNGNSSLSSTSGFTSAYNQASTYSGTINSYKKLTANGMGVNPTVELKKNIVTYNSNGTVSEDTSISQFGPFNITNGNSIKTINLIDNVQTISSNYYKMYISTDGSTWNQFNGNIPNNIGFYVGVPYDYTLYSNIKMEFISTGTNYYNARIALNLSPSNKGQQIAIYAYQTGTTSDNNVKYDIEVPQNNTLKIVKSAESESGDRQDDVGFIIYKEDGYDGKAYGYLRNNLSGHSNSNTGELEYNEATGWGFYDDKTNESREAASIFVTSYNASKGWDGYFQIANLPSGNYYVGEVYNHSKNNKGEQKYKNSILSYYTVQVDNGETKVYYDGVARSSENLSAYKSEMPYTQTVKINLSGGTATRIGMIDKIEEDGRILKILKKNGESVGEGVEFNIQYMTSGANVNKYVLKDKDTGEVSGFVSSKVDNSTSTTTFKTDENGELQVALPEEGTYKIIETKNPNTNYTTTILNAEIKSKPADSTATITKSSNYATITNIKSGTYVVEITDKPDGSTGGSSITLKGYVFVDGDLGKNNKPDGIYQSGTDKPIKGARAYLVRKSNGQVVDQSSLTGDSGYYSITTSVGTSNLKNYYIKVDCTNGKIKDDEGNWTSLDYNSYAKTKSNYSNSQGCKFVEYSKGIGKTYYGTNATSESGYGLTKTRSSNINLGLVKTESEEYVDQTISQVNIRVNDKNYKYYYGQNGSGGALSEAKSAPTVNWQGNSVNAYSRDVYPSDISAYKDGTTDMKVQVTYAITIRNETEDDDYEFDWEEKSTEIEESEDPGEYETNIVDEYCKEDYLKVSSLQEEFDTSMYTLSSSLLTNDSQVRTDQSSWSASGNTATYSKEIKLKKKGSTTDTAIRYVTFDMKKDAITAILDLANNPNGIKEYSRTTAITTSNHGWSNHIDWEDRYWIEASGSVEDGDYEPAHWSSWSDQYTGESEGTRQTGYAVHMAEAPYCIFKLPDSEKERTISGNVFEDTDEDISDHELLGSGVNEWENGVGNVEVTLYERKSNGTYGNAVLYHRSNSSPYYTKDTTNYKTRTDSNGNYSFSGLVAGDYYIVYTYGDGTQVISDGTKVYSSQFKSTIVTDPTVKSKLKSSSGEGEKWYIGITDTSFAVDNISEREYDNNTYLYGSLYEGARNDGSNRNINARTPEFEVGIEFTSNETLKDNNSVTSYDEMDFGIIKMPVISLNIYKTISHVTITLSNGQVITTGDPRDSINYISVLDEDDDFGFGRSSYVKGELDTQYLYGSTLQIKYDINILNTSDVNYRTKNYYKYGEKGTANQEYTVFIDKVLDYLDPNLTYLYCEERDVFIDGYNPTESGLSQSTISYVGGLDASVENAENESERDFSAAGSKVLEINIKSDDERRELYTVHSPEDDNKDKSSLTVISVTASKLLSTEDDDLEFKNLAEIVKITTDKDEHGEIGSRFMAPTASFETTSTRDIGYRSDYRSDTTDVATITITPPTGLLENAIIFISIGIGLIIIATGVIIIKKRIL